MLGPAGRRPPGCTVSRALLRKESFPPALLLVVGFKSLRVSRRHSRISSHSEGTNGPTCKTNNPPTEPTNMVAFNTPVIRLAGRASQFICSLIAISCIGAGFRSASGLTLSSMLGSHATNFGLLMTWTTLLFSLYALVAVEYLKWVPRPSFQVDLVVDVFFAVLLFITGIVLATADVVAHCDAYGYALRCGNLKAGTAFVFIGMFAFIVTAAFTFLAQRNGHDLNDLEATPQAIPYVSESTPTGGLSPIGARAPSPSAKV